MEIITSVLERAWLLDIISGVIVFVIVIRVGVYVGEERRGAH